MLSGTFWEQNFLGMKGQVPHRDSYVPVIKRIENKITQTRPNTRTTGDAGFADVTIRNLRHKYATDCIASCERCLNIV